jgi:hypothetical protein
LLLLLLLLVFLLLLLLVVVGTWQAEQGTLQCDWPIKCDWPILYATDPPGDTGP